MESNKKINRNHLRRNGDFWRDGMPLTETDVALLQILIKRTQELGRPPLVREVPEAAKIKGRFRCWRDAIKATEVLSEQIWLKNRTK